jgi:hypothetical protein
MCTNDAASGLADFHIPGPLSILSRMGGLICIIKLTRGHGSVIASLI